jgi:transcriptional antiterminator Rof (Rho-off)
MPQEGHSTSPDNALQKRDTLEGFVPKIETKEDLEKVLEIAFEYRGDVTITLKSGDKLVAYIFNRVTNVPEPYIECYPRNEEERRAIPFKEIVGVAFTGIDTAAGRSWDSWLKKNEDKKKALAEGKDVGNIEPKTMSMDD